MKRTCFVVCVLSLALLISCQNEQPTEMAEEIIEKAVPYIDAEGNRRIPTWLTFNGRITIGKTILKSDSLTTIMVPREHWLIDELYVLSKSSSSCETEYSYTSCCPITIHESSSAVSYHAYVELCSGSSEWEFTGITKNDGSFTNAVQIATRVDEAKDDCTEEGHSAEHLLLPDKTWSDGTQFDVTTSWNNNFDHLCNNLWGEWNAHQYILIGLLPGGNSDSATFEFLKLKGVSDL